MKVTLQRAYETLGVAQGASEEQARSAYRKLALQFHPDKNPHEDATAKFQEISAAYKRICDFHKRGGNQSTRSAFFHDDDDGDGHDDDFDFGDVDLEDLELSFEEMLMMFEMMFGPTMPNGKTKHKTSKKKAVAKPLTKPAVAGGSKVGLPLGKARRRKGYGMGGPGLSFGGLDDPLAAVLDSEMMMFEQFMGMSMNDPDLNDMEGDSMMEEMMHLFSQTADDLFRLGSSRKARKKQSHKPRAAAMARVADESDDEEVEEVSDWEDEEGKTRVADASSEQQTSEPSNQDASKRKTGISDIQVGQRVVVYGKLRGTAKFVGVAHYSKGSFVGVELDEPEGKNDGTVKGVSYFACKPRHGLMVRPDDVTLFH